jgi:hypothetical protein
MNGGQNREETTGPAQDAQESLAPKRAAAWMTAIGLAIGAALLFYVLPTYHLTDILAVGVAAG